jgi:hypothetical protein
VLDRIALHALLVVPAKLPDDACADRNDIKWRNPASVRGNLKPTDMIRDLRE